MTTITEHTEVLRRMCRHRIDKMYDPDYKHAEKFQRENNEEYAALCAGVTALERNVPCKPARGQLFFICPQCEHFLDSLQTKRHLRSVYCRYCGQRLDWEDNKSIPDEFRNQLMQRFMRED